MPGFVDVHTHYDAQVTWSNQILPSSCNGVTTVLMGNCGVGFAPVRPDHHDMLISLMEGVEDIPEVVMKEGLPWNWASFPDYLDSLEDRRYDVDVATQVPHAALRVFVMGERGANREAATAADRAEMARLAAEFEIEFKKPVIAINTATYWHAQRANGISDKIDGFGSLLSRF